jgi:hypothetical protein
VTIEYIGFLKREAGSKPVNTETIFLIVLDSIAEAIKDQNRLIDEQTAQLIGIANRIEDLGRYL